MSIRFAWRLASVPGALLIFISAAFAQTVDSTQCQTLHTYVSVLKPDGHALTTLTAADFEAETGGKPAQVTAASLHVPEHRVLVLLDHSGSMEGPKWEVAVALARNLTRLLPPKMPIGIGWFDDDLHVLVPLTHDHQNVDESLNAFLLAGPAPKGKTHLFEAIHKVLGTLPTHRAGDVIYLLTDGEADASPETSSVAKEISTSSTRLFATILRYHKPSELGLDPLRLSELETKRAIVRSGGTYFELGDNDYGIGDAQLQIAREANFRLFQNMLGEYELTLIQSAPVSKAERLRLRVQPRNGLNEKVRLFYPEKILPSCP